MQSLGGGEYRVSLSSSDARPEGIYRGRVQLRMCADAGCAAPIANAQTTVSYTVRLGWKNPGDWETFQGNARHDGYVPVILDARRFQKIWEWQRGNPGTVLRGVNAVAIANGRVYVSEDGYFPSVISLYSLDESTGSQVWRQDWQSYPALNPPAVSDGRVYVATTGHQQTLLWSFDALTGEARSQAQFAGQWPHVLAPTVSDGTVYTNGGYYGGGVYAFSVADASLRWSRFAGDDDMTTPAVQDDKVYFYSGTSLNVYDAANGNSLASITDPYSPPQGYSHHGAPILGSPDNVVTFSGGAFSGRASSDVEQYDSRFIVNFSIANYAARWKSSRKYLTQPAVANGVVYAGSNNPKSFDAIDEATGQILWSWVPGVSDTEFHRNVVVTKNLAFVSTNAAVYAIDLVTRTPVWSYPVPGSIAISGDGTLVINQGARESTGKLHAFSLR